MILRRVIDHFRKQEWTAIFLDFVIVVAGVLLALWASQWASDRSARQSAKVVAEAMDADLMEMAIGTMRRFTTRQCLADAINRINKAASVADGAPFVVPPAAKIDEDNGSIFADYYPVGLWNYPMQAFDRAVALGVFNHMEADRAAAYSEAYDWVRVLGAANAEEFTLQSRLSTIAMVDFMDAPTRLELRRSLAELNGLNQWVLNAGQFYFEALNELGIEPADKDRTRWRRVNEIARESRGDCAIDLPFDFSGVAAGRSWEKEAEL